MAKVLLVDDDVELLELLRDYLLGEGFAVELRHDGEAGVRAALGGGFDAVVLDVMMPAIDGIQALRLIRSASAVPVLMLTARGDDDDRITGLELGADDYVPKPFSPRELVSRVRAILRRVRPERQAGAPVAGNGATRFAVDPEGLRIAYHGNWLSLTRYEYLLLALLLERPGRVLSRAQIMEAVWQDSGESLERTVDTHVKTLRAKLRVVKADEDPIATHRGLGYSISAG